MSRPLPTRRAFLDVVDHTLLKPWSEPSELDAFLAFARDVRPKAVCVLPLWVRQTAAALDGTGVLVATVNGFPLGDHETEVKARECELSVEAGAVEIDTVIDIAAIKRGDVATATRDLAAVVQAAGEHDVKVIIEAPVLSDDEIRLASQAVVDSGAAFIKTATGFQGAATPDHVRLMRECVGPDLQLKAAGGMRSIDDARAMMEAGATRLGLSRTADILAEIDEA